MEVEEKRKEETMRFEYTSTVHNDEQHIKNKTP